MATAPTVTVIGAGLAGCEAAWQLAAAGLQVVLIEMKPTQRTPAQVSPHFAELVCSNSLRSQNEQNAVGLLKQEMARLDSLVVRTAVAHRVPAGDALAVDRAGFGAAITAALRAHPRIAVREALCTQLPPAADGPAIVATGPLTAPELAADVVRVAGQAGLYFHDAIAPIVDATTVDRSRTFAASRWDKGDGHDYLNCPLDAAQYAAFVDALLACEPLPMHSFETPRYFAGCLPVEVIAARGREALRFGCMKPAGLTDPRTGRWPHAVLQLRKEDAAGQAFNLVGFQTKLRYGDQRRLLAMVPGLEHVEILRYGAMHRNTYLDAPALLTPRMALRARPHLRFAGQITGVEGYVESAAHGLLVARLLAAELRGEALPPPPPETALGALLGHVQGAGRLPGRPHEPQNVNWSMFPPPPPELRRSDTKPFRVARAQRAFTAWLEATAAAAAPPPLLTRQPDRVA